MSRPDTIVALSTPEGLGAIGVVRISGPDALKIAAKCIHRHEAFMVPRKARYAKFYFKNEVLDDVVMVAFASPQSYTGEHVVEFSFHGSTYILNKAIDTIVGHGGRLAQAGEFSQRAFLNGKMDLSQAEAVADVINAENSAQHQLALRQMRGDISNDISTMRGDLLDFASLIELELDFAEEDVEFANRGQLLELIEKIESKGEALVKSFELGNAIKNGVPVVIVGKPNVGKSTLLNSMVGDERAIVSDIAGTTRDTIEDMCNIDGILFRFVDTAGIRKTNDSIEAIGVQKSFESIKKAQIVILLVEASASANEIASSLHEIEFQQFSDSQKTVIVANKIDLFPNAVDSVKIDDSEFKVHHMSAKSQTSIDKLKELLVNHVLDGQQMDATIISNARHAAEFKATLASLKRAKQGVNQQLSGDLVASDIRNALHHLGLIAGEISTDDLLGNIFGKFCIGK